MTAREMRTDVLVVGGGLGGVACALTLAGLGVEVVLTEPTRWLGGQLTSQAVPPDEHPWIESAHASTSYRRLREGIRDYYRRNYPLRSEIAAGRLLNPGRGFVSPLCHEPIVAVAAIDELLAPLRASGRLTVLTEHTPVAAAVTGDRVEAVRFTTPDGAALTVAAGHVVDATELGDLLELAGVEHVIGAEARADTGELHAAAVADPADQQALSWCFPVEYRPGEHHVVDRPAGYDHWCTAVAPFWPGPQLSFADVEPITGRRRYRELFDGDVDDPDLRDLWHYRRILARSQFEPGTIAHDVTLVNWPQIDYWEAPLLGPGAEPERALARARDLSLSFLHWLQTEAPRPDGGTGYPGLRLRPDLVGSTDGLALAPYVRESRRIRAVFTVREQDVGVAARGPHAGSAEYADSVGVGSYRIDLHPSAAGRGYVDIDTFPFQIPLGALLPVRVENLLPAAKNIGTTHITNGCYRLHPAEWSIGEAVGALLAVSRAAAVPPRAVRERPALLAELQRLLTGPLGAPIAWPDSIRTTPCGRHPAVPSIVHDRPALSRPVARYQWPPTTDAAWSADSRPA